MNFPLYTITLNDKNDGVYLGKWEVGYQSITVYHTHTLPLAFTPFEVDNSHTCVFGRW